MGLPDDVGCRLEPQPQILRHDIGPIRKQRRAPRPLRLRTRQQNQHRAQRDRLMTGELLSVRKVGIELKRLLPISDRYEDENLVEYTHSIANPR